VNRRRSQLVTIALLGLIVSACGKKGPPVAPERRLPAAPAGLAASIDEASIVVTWTLPSTRLDGTALKDVTETKLYRREEGDGTASKPAILASGRIVGYDEIASIAATGATGSVRWVDREGLVLGRRYVYVATALDARGRSSPPSARTPITFLATPKPPTDVRATAGDGQATLRWDAPAEFTDGTPAEGEIRYLVLRGSDEGPMSPVTAEPVTGTAYTDTGLTNDAEYRYAVRSVRIDPRVVAAGLPSTVVAVTPRTITPPHPPSNLVAVPFPGTVRLAWSPSPERTVALYAVYRAAGSEAFVRLGTTAPSNTTFADRSVESGVTYRYAVSAIDSARQPNESARSTEVTVTVP
jgi:fibronectin type 3 domain-containing protein